ncbi:hypothetical protein QE422_000828 [Chryseobacterium sp. SORGH_AS 447]|uniref:COG1470 family protein n=1 Tax=Chryseobacterium sp. SORGH_AS_0447 TaxID=3041769 RepID=UPI0027835B38|nr:hypothetical protein [Chryseobacterium sp. SORGH_AS_0447]MDQ1160460.1 hypothetical protein [Chryseobacterium sp. SORGH_AS_0447]
MIKKFKLYIFSLFPVLTFSQQKDFVDKKDSLPPGTITSVSFILENPTNETQRYDLQIETSDSFIIPVVQQGEAEIPGNGKSVYIVPLKIAVETPQGKYFVRLKGIGKNSSEKFNKQIGFMVAGKRQISLTALSSPEFVKAGEIITSTFHLKNNGNVLENLVLESKNAVIDHQAAITLSAGEERIITVTKNTDPALGKNEYQNVNLSVYSADYPKENQSAYSSIKVISTNPGEEDIFHRLPVAASVSFIGMQNRGEYHDGFQGELYGKGSLDKDHKNLIEFHAVTRNPIEFNSFTPYEEYFVNFKRDHVFVHAGDKNYSSSFLTEYARYGRGMEVRLNTKKFGFGGFYNHPRFFRDIKDEFNVYTKYKITGESEITAGYLYKIPRTENTGFGFSTFRLDSNAHLPYVTGKFKINKNIEVSGEVSFSKTDKTSGNASMLQTVVSLDKISGNMMYMRTSPEYAGYFNNTSTFNGNFQYQIFRKINIMANYVQDAKNFQRDTLFLAAPYRKYLQYGIQYKYNKNGSLMLYSGFQRYEDRLMPKEFDYKERFFRLSLDQQLGIFQINLQGQFGKTDNYLLGFSGNSSFYTANISFEKFRTSFNLYGSYAITSRYQMPNQKQVYYGARILNRFSDKSSFSVFYQNNYMPEEYFADRNLFELLYHQQISPGHEVDLSGRYTLQRGELGNKDFIFSLRYTLRLHLPTQKKADYTTLYGNISNLGVKKVEGIRLMLGNHLSITDQNGNFTFKNIVPGDYVLEIDRSTININDIPNVNIPASLHLTGKENTFNFGLTEAAIIQGTIDYSETGQPSFAQLPSIKDKKKKDYIIVETSNGDQTYRKMAALGEPFDFTYLRPGEWKVKIYRNGLDKKYKIPIEQCELHLKPSETKMVTFHVIKQQTEVKFQQESIRVSYSKK